MSVSPAILIVFFFTYRTSIRSTAELSSPAAPQSLIPFTERAERRTAPHTRCPDGFPLCSGNCRLLSRRRIYRMCSRVAVQDGHGGQKETVMENVEKDFVDWKKDS
ncbi:hypothetical protein EVAR_36976_1 [Eumeta japonica]|uniref:Uncharacterized protein n=1 Tax=Eumeta variegata TaxID=151549 RepID=A0A4C1W7V0_EUMVA|nr:hypothetical protein EVAR_36976_1 [Eumeta japonica]